MAVVYGFIATFFGILCINASLAEMASMWDILEQDTWPIAKCLASGTELPEVNTSGPSALFQPEYESS